MAAQPLHRYRITCDQPRNVACLHREEMEDVGFEPVVERLRNLGWEVNTHEGYITHPSASTMMTYSSPTIVYDSFICPRCVREV